MIYNIFVLVSVVLLYLYYKSDYQKTDYINFIFIGLWGMFSIEYYSTIDYRVYYENFQYPPKGLWEPIYELLITIFKPTGYIFFNSCMAAFEMFTLCFMLKKFVNPRFYWIAIMLFIADPDTVFNFMTVKRQFIAMAVAMWIPYFLIVSTNSKRYIYAVVTFLIAINIHTAALMAILFFGLPFLNRRPGRLVSAIIFIAYFGCSGLLANNVNMLFKLISFLGLGERYSVYISILEEADMDDFAVGPILASCRIITVGIMLWIIPHLTQKQYKVIIISITGYFFTALLFADMWRLAWFFTMFNPISIAISIGTLWKLYNRKLVACVVAFIFLLPLRQYYIVMSGKTEAHQMYKMCHFYNIFDDTVDKSFYSQEEM